MKRLLTICAVVTMVLLWVTLAEAVTIYSGADPGAGPGQPRPNSNATAAAFDAAVAVLGPCWIINFENLPTGNFSSLTVAPGVTVTLSNTDTDINPGISTDNDVILGYNTTAGGEKHLRVVPIFDTPIASANFSFDVPIQAFGSYLTGVGTVNEYLHVVFVDGGYQDLLVQGYESGGVQFYGFTSAGSSITSVTMEMRDGADIRDIFGIDDVRYVVPEPATICLLGLGGLALLRRHRK